MKSGTRKTTRHTLAGLMCLAALSPDPTHAAISYQKVALTGDAAPGLAPGAIIDGIGFIPGMNNHGEAAFRGTFTLPGDPAQTGSAIWAGAPGELRLVVQTNQQAPGTTPDTVFSTLSQYPVINDAGQVSFTGTLEGPSVDATNDYGVWSEGAGLLQLVARRGQQATGTSPGVVFTSFKNIYGLATLNESGQSVFLAEITGPGIGASNNTGVWTGYTGALTKLVQTGDPAPGTENDTVFATILSTPVLTPAGQTIIDALLAGPSINDANDHGIWKADTNGLTGVIRTGEPAPGLPVGVVFNAFGRPRSNASGEVAFLGGIEGPGVTDIFADGNGFWSQSGGQLHLIARAGDPAPGTTDVYGLMRQIVINDAGQTAYTAGITPGRSANLGMWLETDGVSQLITRTGTNAPGTGPGVSFKGYNNGSGPQINSRGQVAFRGELTGTGVDSTNDWGIWATDPLGNLNMIVREGERFDVNDDPLIDDLRTIVYADMLFTGFDGTHNGTPASFNDAGQLLVYLMFNDGSRGLFIANTQLPGDLDNDGFVGITDLNLILENWNQTVPPGDALADTNGDDFIGIEDLNAVLGNWNAGTPPTDQTNIPEPTALLLFLTLSTTLARRRTQQHTNQYPPQ